MQQHKVKVYSPPSCPWCERVKEFLKENKVEFEDINVAADHEAAREMIQKSGQTGVPVTEIGHQIIIGFEPGRIKKALGLA